MRLERFTLRGQEAIQSAIEAAERNQHQQVEPEHLLLAMLEQPEGVVRPLLGKLGANVQVVLNDLQAAVGRLPKVQGGQQYFSPRTHADLPRPRRKQAEEMQDEYISTEHLLLAVADEKDGAPGRILRQHGVNRDDLFKVIEQTRGGARITDQNAEANYQALSKYAQRPDGAGAPGQARPRHRPRRRDTPHDSGPLAPHEEQPRAHRRAGRRQDRHRRRARPSASSRATCRRPCATSAWSGSTSARCSRARSTAASSKTA